MPINGTLLKACGRGNQEACTLAKKIQVLYAGSVISFSEAKIDPEHPNKMPFRGSLLILDEPSQKPPHGSQGHRILVKKEVAKNRLDTLPGMAVNYDPGGLNEHATRHKVGVVTKAWLEGNKVMVGGFIWGKDFPEAEKQLKGRNDLGMSMELADVYVEDEDASVWNLEDFSFTGATILKKDAAAYTKTSLAAKAATREEGEKMSEKKKEKEKKVAAAHRDTGQPDSALMIQAMGGQLTTALQNVLGPLVNEIKASNQNVSDSLAEVSGRLRLAEINAAAQREEDDEDEIVLNAAKEESSDEDDMAAASDSSDEMAAAKHEDDEDEEDDESSSEDDDLAAMEDLEKEAAEEEPGEVNKDASNKGDKKTVTKPPKQGEHFSGNVAKERLHSAAGGGKMKKPFAGLDAAAVQIETLYASNRKMKRSIQAMAETHKKETKKLRNQIKAMGAQLERFSDLESRRSVIPVELTNLAAKAGVDLREIKASGQKLAVEAVDQIFAAARSQGINIEPKDRMAMKNQLIEQGLLEDGRVDRNYGVN